MRYLMPVLLVLLVTLAGCTGEPTETPATEAAPAAGATILKLEGELWQGDRQLKAGDGITLDADFEVRSGRAMVGLEDGSTISIYPKTRLRLVSSKLLRLWLGKIWATIAPQEDSAFSIETDNAVAGVRGTRFLVERTTKRTRVAVSAGKVAVHARKTPDKEILLEAGQQSSVEGEAAASAPVKFDPTPEEKSWEEAAVAPAPAPAAAPGEPPPPKVKVDRKAFEEHEKKGEQQKKELKDAADKQKDQLKKEEQKERDSFDDKHKLQEDLEHDMKNKGSLKPKKGSLEEKSIRPKDDDMEKFLE